MGTVSYRNDYKGIGQLLKGLGPAVADKAGDIAQAISAAHPELDVTVERHTTDRAVATVVVAGRKAMELQVREGLITRAAAMVGLEVKS